MTSPFNWRAKPSQIKLGRIKSEQQVAKDAKRVNPESNIGHSTRDDTKTRIIIGRRNEARSQ